MKAPIIPLASAIVQLQASLMLTDDTKTAIRERLTADTVTLREQSGRLLVCYPDGLGNYTLRAWAHCWREGTLPDMSPPLAYQGEMMIGEEIHQ